MTTPREWLTQRGYARSAYANWELVVLYMHLHDHHDACGHAGTSRRTP